MRLKYVCRRDRRGDTMSLPRGFPGSQTRPAEPRFGYLQGAKSSVIAGGKSENFRMRRLQEGLSNIYLRWNSEKII